MSAPQIAILKGSFDQQPQQPNPTATNRYIFMILSVSIEELLASRAPNNMNIHDILNPEKKDLGEGKISVQAYAPENLPPGISFNDDKGLVDAANNLLGKLYDTNSASESSAGSSTNSSNPSSPGQDNSDDRMNISSIIEPAEPTMEGIETNTSPDNPTTEKSLPAPKKSENRFMCPYFWCTRHTDKGFPNQLGLTRHLASKRHTEDRKTDQYRPASPLTGVHLSKARRAGTGKFPCEWPGCVRSYNKRQSLIAHRCTAHLNPGSWLCPVAGCPRHEEGKGFSQSSNRNQHVAKCHRGWDSNIEGPGPQNAAGV